jgi:hypothetical protein
MDRPAAPACAHDAGLLQLQQLLRLRCERVASGLEPQPVQGLARGETVQADGDAGKTSALAADLLHPAPNVIVTVYGAALRAVKQQTKTFPIVFIGGGDAVDSGTVSNSCAPGG